MTGKTIRTNGAALAQALVSLRRSHDDLRVVSGAGVDSSGFTLLGMLRNEMYFLPAFLAHYRALGVERFVFLNDRSDDGSFEYLCEQPDTVVVESGRRYSDMIDVPPDFANIVSSLRMENVLRSLLHDRFAQDRWALQVDLDEFVRLPEELTLPELVAGLEERGAHAAWGVMLDVYPKDIAALAEQKNDTRLDMSATWYFDGERHLRLRRDRSPRVVYSGARARLYRTYGVDRMYFDLGVRTRKIKRQWQEYIGIEVKPPIYNALQKPVLLKWREGCYHLSSHKCSLPMSKNFLIPIQHFRFTGILYDKIGVALRENVRFNSAADHRLLSELLGRMTEKNGSFLYRKSKPLESFSVLARTGNALGL